MSLLKNQPVSLQKEDPSLVSLYTAIAWDFPQLANQQAADVDVSVFVLGEGGKITQERDLVSYAKSELNGRIVPHFEHPSGGIIHSGDNRDGKDTPVFNNPIFNGISGYDEIIFLDFTKIPSYAKEIVAVVTIDSNHTFQDVQKARFDVIHGTTKQVAYTYDLSEDGGRLKAITAVRFYLHNDGWRMRPIGDGFQGGLAEYCKEYGVATS